MPRTGHSRLGEKLGAKPRNERKESTQSIPVFQLSAVIGTESGEEVAAQARRECLKWIEKRSGKLPEVAWKFQDFEKDVSAAISGAARFEIEGVDYWIARLVDPDKSVPGRIWRTEVTVTRTETQCLFGLRQNVATREDEFEFVPAIPGVVRQLAHDPGLYRNGRPITDRPRSLNSEDHLDELIELIEDPSRSIPIIAISLGDDGTDNKSALIDPTTLASKLVGLAEVVIVPVPLAYLFTDKVGKAYSVFQGAVRTYMPGYGISSDNPFVHPLARSVAILQWGIRGPNDFLSFLIKRAASIALKSAQEIGDIPTFALVKQAALELQRKNSEQEGQDYDQLLDLAEKEIDELKQIADDWAALAQGEEQARRRAESRVDELRSERFSLLTRIDALESVLEASSGRRFGDNIKVPTNIEELPSWTEKNLRGKLVLTSKAVRAAKNSSFTDIQLVYNALLLLAREYRQMRMAGGEENRMNFDKKLKSMGLENSRTGEESRLREKGDEFLVSWDGQKKLLDWHLKNRGNTRDPTRCFRLYYFWDDETQQIIVGSLPGHLETRAS